MSGIEPVENPLAELGWVAPGHVSPSGSDMRNQEEPTPPNPGHIKSEEPDQRRTAKDFSAPCRAVTDIASPGTHGELDVGPGARCAVGDRPSSVACGDEDTRSCV
jgi:hypothetical protein